MSSSMAKYLKLSLLFAVVVVAEGNELVDFEKRSKERVKGCCSQNNGSLVLCFDITAGFMQLTGKNSEVLVRYRKLQDDAFQFQVLDDNFLWPKSAAVPLYTRLDKANNFTGHFKALSSGAGNINTEDQHFPILYQRALNRLQSRKEMRLINYVSSALNDDANYDAITKPFQVMSMSILSKHFADPADPEDCGHSEDPAKRGCVDLKSDPYKNNCLGMCGPGCFCWKYICDDCCFHQGCYEHDLCCRRSGQFSRHCLFPIFYGFNCHRFNGFPSCLKQ